MHSEGNAYCAWIPRHLTGAEPALPRQGSDPLRLDSLVNTWDDEGGIAMLNGALPSLNMNMSLGQQLGVRAGPCSAAWPRDTHSCRG